MNPKICQCERDIEILKRELARLEEEDEVKWIDDITLGSFIKLRGGFTFLVGKCGDKVVMTSISPFLGRYNREIGGPWRTISELKSALKNYVKNDNVLRTKLVPRKEVELGW